MNIQPLSKHSGEAIQHRMSVQNGMSTSHQSNPQNLQHITLQNFQNYNQITRRFMLQMGVKSPFTDYLSQNFRQLF